MEKSKTCFFEKISTIELAFQAYLLSNHIHMGGKNILAVATLSAAALTATSPAIAENSETKVQQETITCETKEACQKLTDSIQAQIDEIETKGLENLSGEEFENYVLLSDNLLTAEELETAHNEKIIVTEKSETAENDELIAVEKSETEKNTNLIATEKQETEKNSNLIATEKSDTKEQEQLIEAKLKAQDAQIAGLRGALLEN